MSAIVWYFEYSLALPFFEIGMKMIFFSPVATAEFSQFAGILSQFAGSFIALFFRI